MDGTLLILTQNETDKITLTNFFANRYNIIVYSTISDIKENITNIFNELCIAIIDLDYYNNSMPILLSLFYNNSTEEMPLPIIGVTSSKKSGNEREIITFGIDDIISKPFEEELVTHKVDNTALRYLRYIQLKKTAVQNEKKANLDGLTNIYNRNYAQSLMEGIIADKNIKNACLIIMDVDSFKLINDYLGHQKGDEVLKQIASILQTSFRSSDIIGRLGGDEFFALMYNYKKKENVINKLHDIYKTIEKHNAINIAKQAFLSMGVAFKENDSNSFDEIYKCADRALYNAKKQGGNKFEIFNPSKKEIYKKNIYLFSKSNENIQLFQEAMLRFELNIIIKNSFDNIEQNEKTINIFDFSSMDFSLEKRILFPVNAKIIALVEESNMIQVKEALSWGCLDIVFTPLDLYYITKKINKGVLS